MVTHWLFTRLPQDRIHGNMVGNWHRGRTFLKRFFFQPSRSEWTSVAQFFSERPSGAETSVVRKRTPRFEILSVLILKRRQPFALHVVDGVPNQHWKSRAKYSATNLQEDTARWKLRNNDVSPLSFVDYRKPVLSLKETCVLRLCCGHFVIAFRVCIWMYILMCALVKWIVTTRRVSLR